MADTLESFIDETAAKYDAADAEETKAATPDAEAEEESPAAAEQETPPPEATEETPAEETAEEKPDEDDAAEDGALDPEFQAQAGKHIPMSIDDVPEAARPMVQKRLKEMEAGFTRAMQEQRAYRKEAAEFQAEKAFLKDRPVDWVVDQFQKNPTLYQQVLEELTKMEEPRYAEARRINREAEEKLAKIEAREQQEQHDAFQVEVQRLDALTFDVAKEEGVPYDFVQDGIEALTHRLAKSENRLPRPDELKALIATKAQSYRRTVGAVRGAKTKDYAKIKAEQSKTAGLKGKPGSQPAPRPPAKPTAPKSNDRDDVIDFLTERVFAGQSE
ncbi:MAG TPA: hypothetical protein VN683_11075 [Acidothermaceae bacterium]|nr:hypothetical protein [Acidothermaceae bacterium]